MNKYILVILGISLLLVTGWMLFSKDSVEEEIVNNDEVKEEVGLDENIIETSWQWRETRYPDRETFVPVSPEAFVLTFKDNGRVYVLTDCNSMAGQYEIKDDRGLIFSEMASTLMYCEGSQEDDFREMISGVYRYEIMDGVLLLFTEDGEGSMLFDPV